MNTYNLIIIGSGPAGLTAALYASRAGLKPLVLAGLNPGGQLMLTTEVENFPGFPKGIQGPELMANMLEQVQHFGAQIINEDVVSVDFFSAPSPVIPAEAGIQSGDPKIFTIRTDTQEFHAKSVIIATGAEANWLGLPSEQRLRGKGVSACATCDGFFFKGKDVVVIGGGDSAMEEASFLTKFAEHVTIIHRREEFKASKIMLERAKANPKISFVTSAEVVEVLGENNVEGVKIRFVIPTKVGIHTDSIIKNNHEQEQVISCSGYFAAIGHTPATKIFKEAGIEVNEKGYIVPKEFTETNIKGVFVSGDVHDHRYRQAITAAGEGCKAALDAEKYLAGLE